jgi:hypothetical protein
MPGIGCVWMDFSNIASTAGKAARSLDRSVLKVGIGKVIVLRFLNVIAHP